MDWGTKQACGSSADTDAYVEGLKARFPEVSSAYVPSGKLPFPALLWLGIGSAVAAPAGAAVGVIVGGIALALVVLIGFLLGLMAAVCGRVLCLVVLLEIAVALGGAALTFASAGVTSGWVVAALGKRGKNRNGLAAGALALPPAFFSFLVLLALPHLAALAVGPADPSDDFALSTLVHMLSDFGWVTIALYAIGFLITMIVAGVFAWDQVGQQKFCEPCDTYMDESELPGLSFDVAAWAFDAMRRGGGVEIAGHLGTESGRDVEVKLFACPRCARGFVEGHAHALAGYPNGKGGHDERSDTWMCFSIATPEAQTRGLATAKKVSA